MFTASDLLIRPAIAADWPAIAALLESHALPLHGASDHLHDYLVATTNDAIVGVIELEAYADVGLLRSAAVSTHVHGRGTGNALTRQLLANARARGMQSLHLLTLTAIDYFTRFGFERTSRAEAPEQLQASAEFRGACPAQATFMTLKLVRPDEALHG